MNPTRRFGLAGVGARGATLPHAGPAPYVNSRFADLVGVSTHVQTWAPTDPRAPTVIGLHHFYGSAQSFHRLGPLLVAAGIRLVTFDRVGFGWTARPHPRGRWTGPDAPYTRAFAGRQLGALLDDLELEQAVLAGTSMGGTTAIEFALRRPDRVTHLVPCSAPLAGDASAPARLRPLLRQRALTPLGAALVRRLASQIDRDRVARSWHDPSMVTAADVDAHVRFRDADRWDVGLWWKYVADERPDLFGRLVELRGIPVTAVGATYDTVVPPWAARRIATDADGAYVEIRSGHLVHAEGATALADVLRRIIGR